MKDLCFAVFACNKTKVDKIIKENFADLNMQKDLAKSMDFALACAFYGIVEGYEAKGEKTPFKTVDKLGAAIRKFSELAPALDAFTAAVTDFFSSDEPEGK